MANSHKIVDGNAPGDFFVDTTCIDCDACRQIAPEVFGDAPDTSLVRTQPASVEEIRRATQALLACPVGSIGTHSTLTNLTDVMDDFPLPIEDEVSFCGFHAEDSYGANSYFIRRDTGNWLVDCPRWSPQFVQTLHRLGGVAMIFLTHRDDIADAARYANEFGAETIIHSSDRGSFADASRAIDGKDPIPIDSEMTIIPTPGHTRGHCALLYRNRFLFTGDHLWWSRSQQRLSASKSVCWYSWERQTESMTRLLELPFEWILPGHGERRFLPNQEMQSQLHALIGKMRTSVA